jgi:DNA primase
MLYLNYREIKKYLTVCDVLSFFKINNLKLKNSNFSGPCPIHGGSNPNAFHFHKHKKIFNCFTQCGGGNILDFIMKYKNVSVYDAGLIALEILNYN